MTDEPHDIRHIPVDRCGELLNEIQTSVKDVREEGSAKYHRPARPDEAVDADAEDDLDFALIQVKVEVLERIDEAVRRLDEGAYGDCVDCGDVIAPSRLRAMPFAVREEARERSQHRARVQSQRVSSWLGASVRTRV